MQQLRSTLGRRFPVLANAWRRVRLHPRFAGPPERVFTNVYHQNKWANEESVSGSGSTLSQTSAVRAALPALLAELNCDSLLDVPCGDFNWMRLVPLDVAYTGGDIVAELVAQNEACYGNERRRFLRLDLLSDALPAADLVLCRDCLVHLSNAHVGRALAAIRASGAVYLLTTTFPGREHNVDIPTGLWRAINLQRPPFCFPEPLRLINEQHPSPEQADKSLGLWRVADLTVMKEEC